MVPRDTANSDLCFSQWHLQRHLGGRIAEVALYSRGTSPIAAQVQKYIQATRLMPYAFTRSFELIEKRINTQQRLQVGDRQTTRNAPLILSIGGLRRPAVRFRWTSHQIVTLTHYAELLPHSRCQHADSGTRRQWEDWEACN
jgi:hypothetical protein